MDVSLSIELCVRGERRTGKKNEKVNLKTDPNLHVCNKRKPKQENIKRERGKPKVLVLKWPREILGKWVSNANKRAWKK